MTDQQAQWWPVVCLPQMQRGAITIDSTVTSADISTSAAGAVDLDETDGITLSDVDTNDGTITVDAGGALTVTDVALRLTTSSGDITGLATVNAGSGADLSRLWMTDQQAQW